MTPDFNTWHADLISDTRWYEQVTMKYKGTFKTACEKLYMQSISDPDLFSRPIQAQRSHLVNMVWKMPIEKVNFVQTHQVEEKKEEKPFVPASEEHKAKCVKEFQEILKNAPNWDVKRFLPSDRMEKDLGEERITSTHYHISDVEMITQAKDQVRRLRNIRRRIFTDAYPEASEDEILAYIAKFEHLDNPNGLFV